MNGHQYFSQKEEEISNKYMSASGNNGNNKSTANEILGGFTLGMLVLFGGMLYLGYKLSVEDKK